MRSFEISKEEAERLTMLAEMEFYDSMLGLLVKFSSDDDVDKDDGFLSRISDVVCERLDWIEDKLQKLPGDVRFRNPVKFKVDVYIGFPEE